MKDINKLNKKQVEKIFDEIYKIQKNICELVIKKFKELNPEFKDLNVKFEKDFVIERYYKSFLMHITVSNNGEVFTELFNACINNDYIHLILPILEENKNYQKEYFIFLVLNLLNKLKIFNEMNRGLYEFIYTNYKVLIADPEFCDDFINKFVDRYSLMELKDYINPNSVDKIREIYLYIIKGIK
jgi:hypothetical protein